MTARRAAVKGKTVRKLAATAARSRPSAATQLGTRNFEAVVAVFAGDARVERVRMFGSPGLKVAGKVFAMLLKDRLVVKLPESQVAEWVAARRGTPFDPGHGRPMKEWLSVPADAKLHWLPLAQSAFEFVVRR
jgi:hypothetical protein